MHSEGVSKTHLGQPVYDNYRITIYILDIFGRGDTLSDIFLIVGVDVPGVELRDFNRQRWVRGGKREGTYLIKNDRRVLPAERNELFEVFATLIIKYQI